MKSQNFKGSAQRAREKIAQMNRIRLPYQEEEKEESFNPTDLWRRNS